VRENDCIVSRSDQRCGEYHGTESELYCGMGVEVKSSPDNVKTSAIGRSKAASSRLVAQRASAAILSRTFDLLL